MIVNSELTLYHKVLDENTRLEKWIRHNYKKVWKHGGKGASANKGYENANDINIRIWYAMNSGLNIKDFEIGDILVIGNIQKDIQTQEDLLNEEIYNITSIVNNTYGNNTHIHLGGK